MVNSQSQTRRSRHRYESAHILAIGFLPSVICACREAPVTNGIALARPQVERNRRVAETVAVTGSCVGGNCSRGLLDPLLSDGLSLTIHAVVVPIEPYAYCCRPDDRLGSSGQP